MKDEDMDPNERIPQIDTQTKKVTKGRAAPTRRNLERYHLRNPHMRNYVAPKPISLPPVEDGLEAGEAEKHVTVWQTNFGTKMSGNSAPFRKNLNRYLALHPECEPYRDQEKDETRAENFRMDTESGQRIRLVNGRMSLRNTVTGKVLSGNCCPIYRNLEEYMSKYPYFEAIPCEADNDRDDNGNLGHLLRSHCFGQEFGPGHLDNCFQNALTHEDEFPNRRESFDESHLESEDKK